LRNKLKNQFDWLSIVNCSSFVKVRNEGFGFNYYYYEMEYLANYKGFHDYIHLHSVEESKQSIRSVFEVLDLYVYKAEQAAIYSSEFLEYLEVNFFSRISSVMNANQDLKNVLESSWLVINGKKYRGAVELVSEILENENYLEKLSTIQKSTVIHGDLTVDNILMSPDHSPVMIDPSDDNSFSGPLIDFARMQQSLKYGYEFLIRDSTPVILEFDHEIPVLTFNHFVSQQYRELNQYLENSIAPQFLTSGEIRNLKFHVAILYFRMLTHQIRVSPNNALKYLSVGVVIMNEFVEELDL